MDGIQLQRARERKEAKYAELIRSRRCRLVGLAVEVGGRWSEEALQFIQLLAKAKARSHPRLLRRSAQAAWSCRCLELLSVAAHRALARTLLVLPVDVVGADGEDPFLEDVLHAARLAEPPSPSRMPA